MPIYDMNDLTAPVHPNSAIGLGDELTIALLKRGEVIALKRPEGEGWVSAKRRFDLVGERLGFRLKLWWAVSGERWYVVRER